MERFSKLSEKRRLSFTEKTLPAPCCLIYSGQVVVININCLINTMFNLMINTMFTMFNTLFRKRRNLFLFFISEHQVRFKSALFQDWTSSPCTALSFPHRPNSNSDSINAQIWVLHCVSDSLDERTFFPNNLCNFNVRLLIVLCCASLTIYITVG